MERNAKLQIYKGIIQYLLESTNYTLKNIADLAGAPLDKIRAIYCHDSATSNFKLELQLLKLYQIVL